MFASFHKFHLRLCLGDECLVDLHRFLLVLHNIAWINVPLQQSYCTETQNAQYPERSGPNGDFIRIDPTKAIYVTVEDARYGLKRPPPSIAGQEKWETIPLSYNAISDHRAGTAAATTSSAVVLIFDQRGNGNTKDLSPSAQSDRRSDTLSS